MIASSDPYVTTGGLARALNSPPLQQRQVVDALRRQRESARGFNPWSCLCAGMRRDLQFGTGTLHLAAAVGRAPNNFGQHYRHLAAGWMQYLRSFGDAASLGLARVHDAIEVRNGLTIKVNPQLAMTFPDGHVEVVQLWFDTEPLSEHTAQVLLCLMANNMSALFDGEATPCVVDVRRGVAYRLPARWQRDVLHIEQYIDAHAARVVSMWGTAAA